MQCKCCPKSYAVKRTIIKHLRKLHNLNSNDLNIKDYYTRLDPRECKLDLDETTMTSIFGPPKKKITDLIGDFVTLHNQKIKKLMDKKEKSSKKEVSAGKSVEVEKVILKQEVVTDDEELEPTDFVSVKIEPMDYDVGIE